MRFQIPFGFKTEKHYISIHNVKVLKLWKLGGSNATAN